MTIIDLSEKHDDLASRHERYWASDEAQRELLALWGTPECNDCGVFERDETIRIELDGNKSWYAEICIAAAPNDWHAFSTNWWSANGVRRHPSGTATPTPAATKPSQRPLTNSSSNSKASGTGPAGRRKIRHCSRSA